MRNIFFVKFNRLNILIIILFSITIGYCSFVNNSFSHNAANQKSVSVQITESTIITFADKNLEKIVRTDLQCPSGDILMGDVSKITTLKNTEDKNIKNLSGIENFINLEHLNLSDNQISNIKPLEGLTNLISLKLATNQIKNIEHLKELTNLTDLYLASNQIKSIEPLEGLTKLISLDLGTNLIKDYSPVSDYYENLQKTDIDSSNISRTIITNSNETTIDSNLVAENTVIAPKPEEPKISDKASEGTVIAPKPEEPKVSDKASESTIIAPKPEEPKISDKASESTVIPPKPEEPKVSDKASEGTIIAPKPEEPKISDKASENTIITFPDKNLEKLVRDTIQHPTGDIVKGDVNKITTFQNAQDKNITNLSGIENFTDLTSLDLSNNQISDIEPLKELTNSTNLNVSMNKIKVTDIESLQNALPKCEVNYKEDF